MSDRIDHKARAEGCLARAEFAEAQVHATLALAEQQRIANLIALISGGDETAYLINGESNMYDENKWRALRAEIREGLGL